MYCSACGKKLLEGAAFCAFCGTPVRGASTPPTDGTAPTEARADQPTMVRPAQTAPQAPAPDGADQPTVVRERPQEMPPAATWAAPPPPLQTGPSPVTPPSGYAPGAYEPPGRYGGPPISAGPPVYAGPAVPAAPPSLKGGRIALLVGISVAALIIIVAALVVWLVVLRPGNNVVSTTTTKVAQSTTTTVAPSTTTSAPSTTTSSATTTSVTLPAGAVGDSAGTWTEVSIPDLPKDAYNVAVSDKALLIDVQNDTGYALYAYTFATKTLTKLPIDGQDFRGERIDGLVAVWWEGSYDQQTDTYSDQHIYSYLLPSGPKVEIAGGGRNCFYPQIAGNWITWVEEERWPEKPDEYWLCRVFGQVIDASGHPTGGPAELVPAATGYAQGDTTWTYTLADNHLAWENATTVDSFEPGIYTMDLSTLRTAQLGKDVWRPSASGDKVVYTDAGLVVDDLKSGKVSPLDPNGDFATAAPTYGVYFRSTEKDGATSYDIVARGYTGGYEQTLGSQSDPPWFSSPLSASAMYVAFVVSGTTHVFHWK